MLFYYVVPQSKTHAFLLDRKLKETGIPCDLCYIPRPISTGVCNMGVKIAEKNYTDAVNVIRRSGLPGCRIYMETINADSSAYYEMNFQ